MYTEEHTDTYATHTPPTLTAAMLLFIPWSISSMSIGLDSAAIRSAYTQTDRQQAFLPSAPATTNDKSAVYRTYGRTYPILGGEAHTMHTGYKTDIGLSLMAPLPHVRRSYHTYVRIIT